MSDMIDQFNKQRKVASKGATKSNPVTPSGPGKQNRVPVLPDFKGSYKPAFDPNNIPNGYDGSGAGFHTESYYSVTKRKYNSAFPSSYDDVNYIVKASDENEVKRLVDGAFNIKLIDPTDKELSQAKYKGVLVESKLDYDKLNAKLDAWADKGNDSGEDLDSLSSIIDSSRDDGTITQNEYDKIMKKYKTLHESKDDRCAWCYGKGHDATDCQDFIDYLKDLAKPLDKILGGFILGSHQFRPELYYDGLQYELSGAASTIDGVSYSNTHGLNSLNIDTPQAMNKFIDSMGRNRFSDDLIMIFEKEVLNKKTESTMVEGAGTTGDIKVGYDVFDRNGNFYGVVTRVDGVEYQVKLPNDHYTWIDSTDSRYVYTVKPNKDGLKIYYVLRYGSFGSGGFNRMAANNISIKASSESDAIDQLKRQHPNAVYEIAKGEDDQGQIVTTKNLKDDWKWSESDSDFVVNTDSGKLIKFKDWMTNNGRKVESVDKVRKTQGNLKLVERINNGQSEYILYRNDKEIVYQGNDEASALRRMDNMLKDESLVDSLGGPFGLSKESLDRIKAKVHEASESEISLEIMKSNLNYVRIHANDLFKNLKLDVEWDSSSQLIHITVQFKDEIGDQYVESDALYPYPMDIIIPQDLPALVVHNSSNNVTGPDMRSGSEGDPDPSFDAENWALVNDDQALALLLRDKLSPLDEALDQFSESLLESTDSDSEWIEIDSKLVPDSDGFDTDYTWYATSDGHHIFILGDKEIYGPDNSDYDMEIDDDPIGDHAQEWFDCYNGFADEDTSDDFLDEFYRSTESKGHITTSGDLREYGEGVDLDKARGPIDESLFEMANADSLSIGEDGLIHYQGKGKIIKFTSINPDKDNAGILKSFQGVSRHSIGNAWKFFKRNTKEIIEESVSDPDKTIGYSAQFENLMEKTGWDAEERFFDYGTGDVDLDSEDIFDKNHTGVSYYDNFLNDEDAKYMKKAKKKVAHIEMMSPYEYFQKCADGFMNHGYPEATVDYQRKRIGGDTKTLKHLRDVLEIQKKKFPMPFLNFSEGSFGQEGRHRMYLAGELFDWHASEFPVLIINDSEDMTKRPYDDDEDPDDEDDFELVGDLDGNDLDEPTPKISEPHYRKGDETDPPSENEIRLTGNYGVDDETLDGIHDIFYKKESESMEVTEGRKINYVIKKSDGSLVGGDDVSIFSSEDQAQKHIDQNKMKGAKVVPWTDAARERYYGEDKQLESKYDDIKKSIDKQVNDPAEKYIVSLYNYGNERTQWIVRGDGGYGFTDDQSKATRFSQKDASSLMLDWSDGDNMARMKLVEPKSKKTEASEYDIIKEGPVNHEDYEEYKGYKIRHDTQQVTTRGGDTYKTDLYTIDEVVDDYDHEWQRDGDYEGTWYDDIGVKKFIDKMTNTIPTFDKLEGLVDSVRYWHNHNGKDADVTELDKVMKDNGIEVSQGRNGRYWLWNSTENKNRSDEQNNKAIKEISAVAKKLGVRSRWIESVYGDRKFKQASAILNGTNKEAYNPPHPMTADEIVEWGKQNYPEFKDLVDKGAKIRLTPQDAKSPEDIVKYEARLSPDKDEYFKEISKILDEHISEVKDKFNSQEVDQAKDWIGGELDNLIGGHVSISIFKYSDRHEEWIILINVEDGEYGEFNLEYWGNPHKWESKKQWVNYPKTESSSKVIMTVDMILDNDSDTVEKLQKQIDEGGLKIKVDSVKWDHGGFKVVLSGKRSELLKYYDSELSDGIFSFDELLNESKLTEAFKSGNDAFDLLRSRVASALEYLDDQRWDKLPSVADDLNGLSEIAMELYKTYHDQDPTDPRFKREAKGVTENVHGVESFRDAVRGLYYIHYGQLESFFNKTSAATARGMVDTLVDYKEMIEEDNPRDKNESTLSEAFMDSGVEYHKKKVIKSRTIDGTKYKLISAVVKNGNDTYKNGETYYFVTYDEYDDVDWGPCETEKEAREFFDNKKESLSESLTLDQLKTRAFNNGYTDEHIHPDTPEQLTSYKNSKWDKFVQAYIKKGSTQISDNDMKMLRSEWEQGYAEGDFEDNDEFIEETEMPIKRESVEDEFVDKSYFQESKNKFE